MSEAALAPIGDETASPNSGENRWPGFGVHVGPENATCLAGLPFVFGTTLYLTDIGDDI